jgi:Transcription factor WhiB
VNYNDGDTQRRQPGPIRVEKAPAPAPTVVASTRSAYRSRRQMPAPPAPAERASAACKQVAAQAAAEVLAAGGWKWQALATEGRVADWWHAPEREGKELRVRAVAVCRRCPLQSDCLAWALACREDHGIWGGKTEEERRALQRRPA